jgi:hypothetical protein
MLRFHNCVATLALWILMSVCASAQNLWKSPTPATVSTWMWGPGGAGIAPHPPFEFVKEKTGGTNPKVEVRDAAGNTWTVKFGSEVHSDAFAARLLNALGYAAEPTFFVAAGSMNGPHDLKRAKHYISRDGSFRNASFKMHERLAGSGANKETWSWVKNPYLGSRELGGLKVVVMLTSNWDTKDSRDGEGSNNEIISPRSSGDSSDWLAVTDWGASFGKAGGFFQRNRWDWFGYRAQTGNFVRLESNGDVVWGFKGKHGQDIRDGVGLDDIRWLLPYLSQITDEELEAGLAASGSSASVAHEFTRLIRERIVQLQRIVELARSRQAAK